MGFQSPAQDYAESAISLDKLCVSRPASTYFVRATEQYLSVGIADGALLVVDSARRPVDSSIVIAEVDGEYRICQLRLRPRPALMRPESETVLRVLDGEGIEVFGVVTYSVNDVTAH